MKHAENTAHSVGDKVKVRNMIEIVRDGEEVLIGEIGTVTIVDDFMFPIEVEFNKPEIQELYEDLGKRRFSSFELSKVE